MSQDAFSTALAELVRDAVRESVREEVRAAVLDLVPRLSQGSKGARQLEPGDDLLRVAEAADLCKVAHCTIREWVRNGRLKAVVISSARRAPEYRIKRTDLMAMLAPAQAHAHANNVVNLDDLARQIVHGKKR